MHIIKMFNLPLQARFVAAPLILIAFCFAIQYFNLIALFEYDRALILQGELWRLVTGHFAHSNINHLLLNCAGVFLIWALHGEYRETLGYFTQLIILSILCSIGLFLFYPDTHRYVGLSGILHGVIILGAIKDCQLGMRSGFVLFFGVWLKIAFEQFQGPDADIGHLINARVAIEAHLLGAFAGSFYLAVWLIQYLKKRRI
ncbi:rhombosortase [Pseudoalteromonas tunicata]|uniref:rhombosortase n=1 Tax=Pseudoalteromonas tunicata TaxID=314281 RepID=UPI00273DE69B|nr:rhombosortase [Pseudoalteromonas tunicata]MDP4984474.1 rhombosortase [Pseudoalteromonas tunicata]